MIKDKNKQMQKKKKRNSDCKMVCVCDSDVKKMVGNVSKKGGGGEELGRQGR